MEATAARVGAGERRVIRNVDPVLLAAAVMLALVGLFAIYSATHQSLSAVGLDPGRFVKRQVTFLAIAAIVLLLVASIDYRLF